MLLNFDPANGANISRRCSRRYLHWGSVMSISYDHFIAGPNCCLKQSALGRIGVPVAIQLSVAGSHCRIKVCVGPITKSEPTPHDHVAVCPAAGYRVGHRARWWPGSCPAVGTRDHIFRRRRSPHPRPSFHFRSTPPCDQLGDRALGEAGGVQRFVPGLYRRQCIHCKSPYLCGRPRRSFDHQPTPPTKVLRIWRVGGAGDCPIIRAGSYSPPC